MKKLLYLKDDDLKQYIEKIFLGYRETVSDARNVLNKYSIGVAHNKVIHLISLYEGITISDLLKVSKFSRPTVNSTVYEALNLGYLEEVSGINDRRRNDFRPTKPMLESWNNYCNALLVNPEFSNLLKLAQTLILAREFEANLSENNM